MKGFALLLLCFVAAVQSRSTAVQSSSRALASVGENPYVVHLRLAIGSSGYLNSCAGSLIDASWILTSAGCVDDFKFIWIRYGVVTVIHPELVTESTNVQIHPTSDIALIGNNRVVHSSANIAPIALATSDDVAESATFCGWGATSDGAPGEDLSCFEVSLEVSDDSIIAQSDDGETTKYDIGSALVSGDKQIGILTKWADENNAGTFISPANFIDWIEETSGVSLRK